MLWKYYVQWKKVVDKETLLYYLKSEKWNLQKIFQKKDIYTAYASLQYLNGIINNNLPNYKVEAEALAPKQDDMDVKENKGSYAETNSKRKKSLAELEEEAEC